MLPLVKPHIAAMSAYSPPWSNLDRKQYLRLDLNENTQAPPECVNIALKNLIDDQHLQMYPDYSRFLPKLCQYVGVEAKQLIITNGSDQAIEIILRAYLAQGDAMLIAQPEFPIFSQVAKVIGADVQTVAYNSDMSFPFEQFLKAVQTNTKLIILINPNNPTGTALTLEQIETILAKNPSLPVVVDEAYFEFTGVTCKPLLEQYQNLIIIRTFSKAFAMAGLRLGYMFAHPDIISQFYKIRAPFDVNSCALAAAEAQLEHPTAWKKYVNEVMTESKPLLEKFLKEHKIDYHTGAANFMLVKPKNRDESVNYLKQQGILVRPMIAPGIEDTFRVSIGTIKDTERFISVFASSL
jgi:histidinol-phosphate aminotransferase